MTYGLTDDHEKNPDNVARGLKAAIHNPNVSVEAKDHAAQQLKEMDSDAHEAHLRHQLGKKNKQLEWQNSGRLIFFKGVIKQLCLVRGYIRLVFISF